MVCMADLNSEIPSIVCRFGHLIEHKCDEKSKVTEAKGSKRIFEKAT